MFQREEREFPDYFSHRPRLEVKMEGRTDQKRWKVWCIEDKQYRSLRESNLRPVREGRHTCRARGIGIQGLHLQGQGALHAEVADAKVVGVSRTA